MSTQRWGRCGTKRLLTGAAGGTCHQRFLQWKCSSQCCRRHTV